MTELNERVEKLAAEMRAEAVNHGSSARWVIAVGTIRAHVDSAVYTDAERLERIRETLRAVDAAGGAARPASRCGASVPQAGYGDAIDLMAPLKASLERARAARDVPPNAGSAS